MTTPVRSIGVSICVAILSLLGAENAVGQRDSLPLKLVSGTTGLNSVSVFGTSGTWLALGTTETVAGLTTSISVPTNSVTIISTDGGVLLVAGGGVGLAKVDIRLWVDGIAVPNGGYRQLAAGGDTSVQAIWSMQVAIELTPGAHTIEVKVTNTSTGMQWAQYPYVRYPPAPKVGGDAASGLQGTLTVTTLKR